MAFNSMRYVPRHRPLSSLKGHLETHTLAVQQIHLTHILAEFAEHGTFKFRTSAHSQMRGAAYMFRNEDLKGSHSHKETKLRQQHSEHKRVVYLLGSDLLYLLDNTIDDFIHVQAAYGLPLNETTRKYTRVSVAVSYYRASF